MTPQITHILVGVTLLPSIQIQRFHGICVGRTQSENGLNEPATRFAGISPWLGVPLAKVDISMYLGELPQVYTYTYIYLDIFFLFGLS